VHHAQAGPPRRRLEQVARPVDVDLDQQAVVALPGDRFIVRSYSPQATIAGGEIVDAHAERHRRRDSKPGQYPDLDDLRQNWKTDRQWEPRWNNDQRDTAYFGWEKAVQRTLNWI